MRNCLNVLSTLKWVSNTMCVLACVHVADPVPSFTDTWRYSQLLIVIINYSRDWRAVYFIIITRFRGLHCTYWWTRGPLKAIWSSFTSNPLDSDRTRTSRRACGAALPPSSLETLLPSVSSLRNRLTTSAGLGSGRIHQNTRMRNPFCMDRSFTESGNSSGYLWSVLKVLTVLTGLCLYLNVLIY